MPHDPCYGALGLLGWSRKRKNAAAIAATWSNHLIGFRRDRGGLSTFYDERTY
jgi:hypothetical protein